MMRVKIVIAVLTAVLLGTGVGWAQNFAVPWAGYFGLEWEAGQSRSGQPVIAGYISNDFAVWADNVRLLVELLDTSGRVVADAVGYVDSWVPPRGRIYFEVSAPRGPSGASYRVTVHSWAWRRPGL